MEVVQYIRVIRDVVCIPFFFEQMFELFYDNRLNILTFFVFSAAWSVFYGRLHARPSCESAESDFA